MDSYDQIAQQLLAEEKKRLVGQQQKGPATPEEAWDRAGKVMGTPDGGDAYYQQRAEYQSDISRDPMATAMDMAGSIGLDLNAFIAKQSPEDQQMLNKFFSQYSDEQLIDGKHRTDGK